MSITVIQPGMLTTVQDLGRYGYQKYGVLVSGAMDGNALRLANCLVGNHEDAAGLEMTLLGPTLTLEEGTLFAITGANLSPTMNGQEIPMDRPVLVQQMGTLRFGACVTGCRAYLAVAGGVEVAKEMGSRSTYLRAGIGGYHGRKLERNDILPIGVKSQVALKLAQLLSNEKMIEGISFPRWRLLRELELQQHGVKIIQVMKDRHFGLFTEDSIHKLLHGIFEITQQSDRMGYRLSGLPLALQTPLEMVSEATNLGTIQVPPDGNPIVLLADRQTVGGYPKIAQVAAVDLHALVQQKPGDRICFRLIDQQQAEQQYVAREKYLLDLKKAILDRIDILPRLL